MIIACSCTMAAVLTGHHAATSALRGSTALPFQRSSMIGMRPKVHDAPQIQRSSSIRVGMPPKVHEAYTRKEDQYLWAHKDGDMEEVASELGRGAKSCVARLKRLRNPSSSGHARLFGADCSEEEDGCVVKEASLRPVRECFQRILYDPLLDGGRDFRVGYMDRFLPVPCEVDFLAPNDSISGYERTLVQALPEHRIEYILYKKRCVWHKAQRLDDIFGSRGGLRIQNVVDGYSEWESGRRAVMQHARKLAVAALGGRQSGGDERLALFRKLIGKVKRGSVTVTEFADAALSPAFFGADGRGEAANGNIVGEDPALTALVATLPDEIAEFREELLEALRGRMSSGSSSSTTTHVTRDPV